MKKYKIFIYYFIIVIPIIIFYGLFFRYTVNAPINDDYNAILGFINKIISTDSYSEKFKLLFSQHNEHRIVYDRFWTIISYKLQKNVDFNFLSFIGNLSLLGIAIVFYKRFLLLKKHLLLFVPITIFIFNITLWENITFAMATLSNLTVHFFIVISLVFITSNTIENKKNLYFSFLFLILATLTQGGGLFLIPISLLILFYKKEYKNLFIYLFISIIILALYFYDYQKPPHNVDTISTILEYKQNILFFAFAFLGNAFNYYLIYTNNLEPSILTTTIIGGLFFLLFLYITFTKYYKKNMFVYSVMLLIVMSSFITAISRISLGIETAGASRYRINGIIFFITIYFWFIETQNFKKAIYVYFILAFSFCYYGYFNLNKYEYLYIREKWTYVGILNYNHGNVSLLNGNKTMINLYKEIIEQSKQLNTYNFPNNKQLEVYFPFTETITINKRESGGIKFGLTYKVESVNKISDSYLIEGWVFLKGQNTKTQKIYIGLKNTKDQKPTFYLAQQIKRFDLSPFFKRPNLINGGYLLRIKDSLISEGENSIWIMYENENHLKIQQTDKKIIK